MPKGVYQRKLRPILDRFLSFVVVDPETNCWNWTGSVAENGYARFMPVKRGTVQYAHRWAYLHYVGAIPNDRVIDHLCRSRRCVNPKHLDLVTQKENLRRGVGHGSETRCLHGHDFDTGNTYFDRLGRRQCRACARDRTHRYYWANPEKFRARKRAAKETSMLPHI
jgi:hypothetical protein